MKKVIINDPARPWQPSTSTKIAHVDVDGDAIAHGYVVADRLRDFTEEKTGVVVFGAGPPHALAPAGVPSYEIVGTAGSGRREYRVVAVTKGLGHAAAGPALVVNDAPDTFDADNYVRVIPDVDPGPALFHLPPALTPEPKARVPSEALRSAFSGHGVELAPEAILAPQLVERRWMVETRNQIYILTRTGGRLEVAPGAYQYWIYGRSAPGGDFRFFGAIVAQAFRQKFWRLIHFDDVDSPVRNDARMPVRPGGEPLDARFLPDDGHASYVPSVAPESPRSEYLRTRIVGVDRGSRQIRLDDGPSTTVSGALMAHDNSLVFQHAIDDAEGSRLLLPAGSYRVYGNLYIDRGLSMEGNVNLPGRPSSTKIELQPGFGLESKAAGVVVRDVRFEGRRVHRLVLPAGGRFVTRAHFKPGKEPRDSRMEVFHGCGVLVQRRSDWEGCAFAMIAGTGHAIWGYPNANHTHVDGCWSTKNVGHGFYVGGSGNTNACTWLRSSVVGNAGWGIYDSGFLGNHMYGCHAHGNRRGQYLVEDSTAHSTVVGCYSEAGSAPSRIKDRGVVLGGDHGAGFADDTNALMLLSRRNVSPITIQREIRAGRPPYHLPEDVHHAVEIGDGIARSGDRVNLLRFRSDTEALEHTVQWHRSSATKPIERIRFLDGRSHGNHPGMEWCQGDVRGHGLMAFPGGFLLRRDAGEYGTERKVSGWTGRHPWEGTYAKGDLLIDLNGEDFFYRPTESFGVGEPWQGEHEYWVGDTVVVAGEVHVVHSFRDPVTGTRGRRVRSGHSGPAGSPPSWATGAGALTDDHEVVWQHWGPEFDPAAGQVETFGRRTVRQKIDSASIPASGTHQKALAIRGVEVGDTVVATPEADLPAGLVWNSLVAVRGRHTEVVLRISNITDAAVNLPSAAWRLDCFKH